MSSIALIICTIFILFMLRLDRKQSSETSFAFWIPTIWFLVVCSKSVGIWLHSGSASMEEGNPVDRTFLIIVLCLSLIILLKRKFIWSSIIKDNGWLFVLLGFMLIACLWASDPFISFKRWSRELIAIVIGAVIASEAHPFKALESLFRRTIYILIPVSYITINYFPEYGRIYVHNSGDLMWIGATMHKNSLTQLCVFAIFFIIWTFIRRHQGRSATVSKYQTFLEVLILLLSFWIMGGPNHSLTYSASAAIALIIGSAMLFCFYLFKKQIATLGQAAPIILIIAIIIYGTITPMIGKLSLFDISSIARREENLTGRAEVWHQLVPVAMERPILGHGYEGFWTTSSREAFDIPTAHNGYLDIILTLGFMGLILYSFFLVDNVRKAHKMMTQNFDWGVFWVCNLVMSLACNITESSFISFETRPMVVILFLTFASKMRDSSTPEVTP